MREAYGVVLLGNMLGLCRLVAEQGVPLRLVWVIWGRFVDKRGARL